jgi:hypothetical protein
LVSGIVAQTFALSLRVKSGRDFTFVLLERVFTESSNFMKALLHNDSEQIKKLSKATWNSLNKYSLSVIMDAWQTCLSDYQWILIVMLASVRLVFSTVSCAARSKIAGTDRYLSMANLNPIRYFTDNAMFRMKQCDSILCVFVFSQLHCDGRGRTVGRGLFPNLPSVQRILPSVQRIFLVGDEKQLPATIMSQDLNQRRFGRSLFERFAKAKWPTQMLLVRKSVLFGLQYLLFMMIGCRNNIECIHLFHSSPTRHFTSSNWSIPSTCDSARILRG